MSNRTRVVWPMLLTLILASCGSRASEEDSTIDAQSTDPQVSTASTCQKLMEQFNAIKDNATGTCTVDTDCAMFPILSSCGHVTDKISSDAARAIREQYRATGCPGGVRCAPRVRGQPYCNGGTCAEGDPKSRR